LDGALEMGEKGGKAMKDFTRKVKVFFKSGIRQVHSFFEKHKKSMIKKIGKVVIFIIKTIIESIIDNLF